MRIRPILLLAPFAAILAGAHALDAQEKVVRVVVVDSLTRPIPYAFVQLNRGVSRTADDSGRATFAATPADSVRVHVRRMGYLPFEGWVRASTEPGTYHALLGAAPRSLEAVRVDERRNTSLARTGFYERVERVQRGAYAARLFTPEELDLRNPAKVSQLLSGESGLRVTQFNGRAIIGSRTGRCGLSVILDGRLMPGMMEELINVDLNPALRSDLSKVHGNREQEQQVMQRHASTMTSIDELINAGSIAAIEVYYSQASVPAEFQRLSGKGSCGAIVLWSGARR